jgi:hypothetical protein
MTHIVRKQRTRRNTYITNVYLAWCYGVAQACFTYCQLIWTDVVLFTEAHLSALADYERVRVELPEAITKCVLQLASDYKRRILDVYADFPYVLLWFAHVPPTVASAKRVEVAMRLLSNGDDVKNSIVASKMRFVFLRELHECANNGGIVSLTLFAPMMMLCAYWTADTQEIEGIMNLIKLAAGPSRTLSYVDAAVALVKDAGMGSRASKGYKYSDIKATVDDVIDDAAKHLRLADEVMGRIERWAAPKAILRPIASPAKEISLSVQWGAGQALVFHRLCQQHQDWFVCMRAAQPSTLS